MNYKLLNIHILLLFNTISFGQTLHIEVLKRDQQYYNIPRLVGHTGENFLGDCFYFDESGILTKSVVGQFQASEDGVTISSGVVTFEKPQYGFTGPGAGSIFFRAIGEKNGKKQKLSIDGGAQGSKLGSYYNPKTGFVIPLGINDFFIYNKEGNYHCFDKDMASKWATDLSGYGINLHNAVFEDGNTYVFAESEKVFTLIRLDRDNGKVSKIEIKKETYKLNGAFMKLSSDGTKIYVGYTYGRTKYEFWKSENIFRGNGFGIVTVDAGSFSLINHTMYDFPSEYTSVFENGEKGVMNAFVEDLTDLNDDLYVTTSSHGEYGDSYGSGNLIGPVAVWKISQDGTELLGILNRSISVPDRNPRLSSKLFKHNNNVFLLFQTNETPKEDRGTSRTVFPLKLVKVTESVDEKGAKVWEDEVAPYYNINVNNGTILKDGSLFMLGRTKKYNEIITVKLSF